MKNLSRVDEVTNGMQFNPLVTLFVYDSEGNWD